MMHKYEVDVKLEELQKELEKAKIILMTFRIQQKLRYRQSFGKLPGVRSWIAYAFWRLFFRTERALFQAVLKLF